VKQLLLAIITFDVSITPLQAGSITLWATNASSTIYEFNGSTGAAAGTFTAPGPVSRLAQYGGNVYLMNEVDNAVYEYSNNGAYLGTVIDSASAKPFDATDIAFGLDGDLYLTLATTNEVVRYTSAGAFLGVFGPGPAVPHRIGGMAFRADGLYVADYAGMQTLVYSLTGGSPTIVDPSAGQVDSLAFGPTGDLFDSNDTTNMIDDLTAPSVFAGGFAGSPRGLQFQPDGFLYVADQEGSAIDRVNAATGGTVSVFASGEGLTNALDFAFVQNSGADTPEPSTALLLLAGLLLLPAIRKRERSGKRKD
jgi:MYXO-CTERM domain-containing protein